MPLSHRGFGAYISHNGKEVDIHRTKVERDMVTMSGYIVSEAGMEFKVHWVESKPPSHLSVEIRMDGRRMGVVSHVKGSSKTSNCGFRVAVDALTPYQFAPLVTHDDDDLPSAYTEDLGTIEIKLRRVRDFISVPFMPRIPKTGGSVHERKTKGRGTGSHCVSLGDKKEVKARSTVLKPLLIDDKPYVVFRFYYRPREFLESTGIIRGRSPSRSSSATVVGSAKSTSGHRKKKRQRPPSEAPPSSESASPGPPKRHRTVLEQNEDVSTPSKEANENRQTSVVPDADEDDIKEDVVEVRLSSKDNYAIPGERANSVSAGPSISIKREGSPVPPQRRPSKRVKREASVAPAKEASRRIKREPSPLPSMLPRQPTRRIPSAAPVVKMEPLSPPQRIGSPPIKRERMSPPAVKEEPSTSVLGPSPHVKREPSQGDALASGPHPPESAGREPHGPEEESWDEEEETLVEIHVSSRNQHLVFGRPPKKTESDGVKRVEEPPE